jgi:hypothetical protein
MVKRFERPEFEEVKCHTFNKKYFSKELQGSLLKTGISDSYHAWAIQSMSSYTRVRDTHFRSTIRYQTQNFGTNLNRLSFDPNDKRWRT